jgi:glucose/arabinose dehydrogenase
MRVARVRVVTTAALLVVVLAGCFGSKFQWPSPEPPGQSVSFRDDLNLTLFADGLDRPLLLLPEGDGGPLLVVEQSGRIWGLEGGQKSATPFLDISDRVGTCHFEQGLLGAAFPPDYATSRRVYVAYTDKPCEKSGGKDWKGDLRLSRFKVGATADAATEETLLKISEPYRNHNGGNVAFGPDGYLYLGVGDGGDHGDPHGNGQNPKTLLGTILRLDVSGPSGYTIPPDNPFKGSSVGRDEVYIYGVRNPWRFDFNWTTGDLWIADVGQDKYEEVNHLRAGSIAGANLGWSLFEGNHRFRSGPAPPNLVYPVAEYDHDEGRCSITGGPFLESTPIPGLSGAYLYADFCSGRMWALRAGASTQALMDTGLQVTGFGTDRDGNIFLTHWDGSVHQLVHSPTTSDG